MLCDVCFERLQLMFYQRLFRPDDPDDLLRVRAMIDAGVRAYPHSYFHVGVLQWWVYYDPTDEDIAHRNVYVWEDAHGDIVGLLFYVRHYLEFEMIVHPRARGSCLESEMIAFAEAQLRCGVHHDALHFEAICVFLDDIYRRALLDRLGYMGEPTLTRLWIDLTQPLPTPVLPKGFAFLPAMRDDAAYLAQRVGAHVNAFTRSLMTPHMYAQFMRSAPLYDPALDVVAVAPDGTFAAFALTWYDDALQWGEFEPVGTRQAYQRQGIGRAVMLEGLRRLKARGATHAHVACHAEHLGTRAFYRACGFREVTTVYSYKKELARR